MSGGDSNSQLNHEVTHLTREAREAVLGKASLPIQVHVPVDHALAMKSDLQLPWNRMRELRRYT